MLSVQSKSDNYKVQKIHGCKVIKLIEKIAKDVDEKVGDHQKIEEMLKVAAELGGSKEMENLITPTRKFVECFDVKICLTKNAK